VPGPAENELRAAAEAWAEQTAIAQGLPARVQDLEVLRSVCLLLELRASDAPDREKP
jgi:hypothetical protein